MSKMIKPVIQVTIAGFLFSLVFAFIGRGRFFPNVLCFGIAYYVAPVTLFISACLYLTKKYLFPGTFLQGLSVFFLLSAYFAIVQLMSLPLGKYVHQMDKDAVVAWCERAIDLIESSKKSTGSYPKEAQVLEMVGKPPDWIPKDSFYAVSTDSFTLMYSDPGEFMFNEQQYKSLEKKWSVYLPDEPFDEKELHDKSDLESISAGRVFRHCRSSH